MAEGFPVSTLRTVAGGVALRETVERLAEAVVWLLGDDSREVDGAVIRHDGDWAKV